MRIVRECSGFTIIELTVALVILAVLMTIATSIYLNYISKARVTVANSILDNAGKTLLNYEMDKGRYPASIDFTSCVDDQGHMVFPFGLLRPDERRTLFHRKLLPQRHRLRSDCSGKR